MHRGRIHRAEDAQAEDTSPSRYRPLGSPHGSVPGRGPRLVIAIGTTILCCALLITGCSSAPDVPQPLELARGLDTLDWKPSWPGTQMAVLRGDPSGKGPFTFRFRMPGGYWIHPHIHPVNARIRVVSGTFLVGMGTVLDSKSALILPAGRETTVEAGMIHFEGTRGETVVEVSGEGPWGITFLDPSKDPARSQTPTDR